MAQRTQEGGDETVEPGAAAAAGLVGHEEAERTLYEAWRIGRLGHAWMLCGPQGIGKATLAFRFARYLLANNTHPGTAWSPDALYLAPDHPVFRRIQSGAHPDLCVLERGVDDRGRQRTEIVVDDARQLSGFFALTAADGGWRVAIVDPADELNRNAANAVLKILEEPPDQSLLLLVAHAPGRLLPTIRSRCRKLQLRPLAEAQVDALIAAEAPELTADDRRELVAIADGSAGRALEFLAHDGLDAKREVERLLESLPDLDLPGLHAFCAKASAGRSDHRFRVAARLIEGALAGVVRAAAGAGAGHGGTVGRLAAAGSLEQWIEVWEKVAALIAGAERLNLDRKQVLLSAFTAMRQASRG